MQISPVYRGNLLWDREGLTCIVEKLCNFQAGIMKLFQEYHFDSTVKEVQKRSIRRLTWQQRDFFFFSYAGIIYYIYKKVWKHDITPLRGSIHQTNMITSADFEIPRKGFWETSKVAIFFTIPLKEQKDNKNENSWHSDEKSDCWLQHFEFKLFPFRVFI